MQKTKNLNIYIIHCAALTNRDNNIKNLKLKFKTLDDKYSIKYNLIEDYAVETLNKDILQNLIKMEKIEDEKYASYNNFLSNMTSQSISKTLKHYKAYQEIKKNKAEDLNMIIEDDVDFEHTEFAKNFDIIIEKLDNDFDICLLGLPSSTDFIEANTINIIESNKIYNTIPGADSYLISNKCAQLLAKELVPIRFDLNIQLSYVTLKNKIKVQQCSPNIMVEGSKIGIFKSTVNVNNIPIYNFKYKEVSLLIAKPELDADDLSKLNKLWDDEILKNNPDFIYLKALYLFKLEKYKESKDLFDQVYKVYKGLCLPITKDTNFLNNYVEIFKFVQD